jgi:hypothetical protein
MTANTRRWITDWHSGNAYFLWAWALLLASGVSIFGYFDGQLAAYPTKFWTDRVPGYFTGPLVYTAMVLLVFRAVARAIPAWRAWPTLFLVGICLCDLYILVMAGLTSFDWPAGLRLTLQFTLMAVGYLLPPWVACAAIRLARGSRPA